MEFCVSSGYRVLSQAAWERGPEKSVWSERSISLRLRARTGMEFNTFPATLRRLLEAELLAGNTLVEISSTHPAPPAGAYAMLQNPVSTRPRQTANGLTFRERNSSHHSGEFTDQDRLYFVLESPLPPPPEPDMDAIREELAARERASNASMDRFR